MRICENCANEHLGNYASGRFCSQLCSKTFSSRYNRLNTNEKIRKGLIKYDITIIRYCKNCNAIIPAKTRKKTMTCSRKCGMEFLWKNPEYRYTATKQIKDRCSTSEEKIRLREIGRNGGFGKRGYTTNGIYYQSELERKCFEFMDISGINYIPHKQIPESAKMSDIFLVNDNTWIEIDGIDREKRKKWLGKNYEYWLDKLEIYKKLGLNLVVIKNYKEFEDFIKNRSMV